MDYTMQKWLGIFCLGWGVASAEIWESSIRYNGHIDGGSVWFDTTNREMVVDSGANCIDWKCINRWDSTTWSNQIPDLQVQTLQVSFGSYYLALLSFNKSTPYGSLYMNENIRFSNLIYYVSDETQLDFSEPLPLDADYYQESIVSDGMNDFEFVYLLGLGIYENYKSFPTTTHGTESFLFKTHSGYYALCHLTLDLNEDKYNGVSSTYPITTKQLTCAVQTDGTTRFDSLPRPTEIEPILRPVIHRSIKKSGLYYGVDGTLIRNAKRRVWQVLGD